MIVLDASVLANLVADDTEAGNTARHTALAASEVWIPDLADVETVSVLRRRWTRNDLSTARFRHAIDDLVALPFVRVPSVRLMARAFELRANVTASDACYVALAEALDATLVTADARLAAVAGVECRVTVLS